MAGFRALCVGFRLLAPLPVLNATLQPSACRLPMIPHYIAYASFKGFAGIIYLLAVPDIHWGSKTRKFVSHVVVIE
ncbi:hypothetical protein BDW72DRAFT_74502 [Aspergillus terricola var. indicus]